MHRYFEGPLVQTPLLFPPVLHGMVSTAHETGMKHVSSWAHLPAGVSVAPPAPPHTLCALSPVGAAPHPQPMRVQQQQEPGSRGAEKK